MKTKPNNTIRLVSLDPKYGNLTQEQLTEKSEGESTIAQGLVDDTQP